MNWATSGGNWWKCALTLFLRINPLSDLVGSSEVEGGERVGAGDGQRSRWRDTADEKGVVIKMKEKK